MILLMQTPRRVFCDDIELFCRRSKLIGRVGDTLDSFTETLLHSLQRREEVSRLVTAYHVNIPSKVATSNDFRDTYSFCQWLHYAACKQHRQNDSGDKCQDHRNDDTLKCSGGHLQGVIASSICGFAVQVDKAMYRLRSATRMPVQLAFGNFDRVINAPLQGKLDDLLLVVFIACQ